MLIPKFAELIYNGFWFSPEMDFIMCAFDKSQEAIDGTVQLALYTDILEGVCVSSKREAFVWEVHG